MTTSTPTPTLGCTTTRAALSCRADGEPLDPPATPAAVDRHVHGCDACRAFEADLDAVRQLLRFEPVDAVPDVSGRVLAAITGDAAAPWHRRRSWTPVAAAAVVGAVAGAAFVGLDRDPTTVAAADLPALVLDAQHDIGALHATIEIVDGDRTSTGTIDYRAPESLAVVTADADGRAFTTVVEDDRWWATAERRCVPPPPAGADRADGCGPPVTRAVLGREPFADAQPVPLELVAPVDALGRSGPPTPLGTRSIDGRDAVGVAVTAGQIAALLDGLDPLGSRRPVHPTDPVELWLDEEHLVPLEVTVRAGDGADRLRWAAALGHDDEPGELLLAVRLRDVDIDVDVERDAGLPPAPTAVPAVDGGFVDGAADDPALATVPVPVPLPAGMVAHRAGTVVGSGPPVGVRTWSDGRAWLSVRATDAWPGGRLFGGLGRFVRPVDLGAAGVGYVDATGTRLAIHGDGIDVVVTGSLTTAELEAVAASLGIVGRAVPDGWVEAATATIDDADAAVPGLLVPAGLDDTGFGEPAVRIDGDVITLAYAGPGDRAFQLVRTGHPRLAPPLDPDVVAVTVRGTTGRWSAVAGALEWVEDGVAWTLRGPNLAGAELLTLAESLEPVR